MSFIEPAASTLVDRLGRFWDRLEAQEHSGAKVGYIHRLGRRVSLLPPNCGNMFEALHWQMCRVTSIVVQSRLMSVLFHRANLQGLASLSLSSFVTRPIEDRISRASIGRGAPLRLSEMSDNTTASMFRQSAEQGMVTRPADAGAWCQSSLD